MYANETAMHQPEAVHYIATVYALYLFQRSFVSLSKIKSPTAFYKLPRLTLFRLALDRGDTFPHVKRGTR